MRAIATPVGVGQRVDSAEKVLNLNIPDLDTVNRCAVVTRRGGGAGGDRVADRHRPAAAAQLAGRRTGPLRRCQADSDPAARLRPGG
ncbi:hypothetical protein AB0B25_16110 [Nocardia sp. NPDC049190]|uniref:hypothetical protein n=1 Tax=Nocardia sp. NPDC049190 TaxID=3155650 RepID=UPI0033DC3A65